MHYHFTFCFPFFLGWGLKEQSIYLYPALFSNAGELWQSHAIINFIHYSYHENASIKKLQNPIYIYIYEFQNPII